ncbi:MAG: hypothetical protein ACQER9_03865 [Nanobdellota archaeon]
MKQKINIIITLILMTFLLTSCSDFGPIAKEDHRKGYNSLIMRFIPGNPPDEILEDSSIAIGINLKNKGAYNIKRGLISISTDEDYLNLYTGNSKNIELEGRNEYNPEGQEKTIFFEGRTRPLSSQSFENDVPISIRSCFQYKTELSDNICIDTDYKTSKDSGEKVCEAYDPSYNGQGSPLGISSIDMKIIPSDENLATPHFDITFRHNGRGMILPYNEYRKPCSYSGNTATSMNTFKIDSIKLSGVPMKCERENIKLKDNEAKVRCYPVEPVNIHQMPYTAPISITLEYGYSIGKTTSFRLVRK